MSLELKVFHQTVPLAKLFRISRGAKSAAEVIVTVVSDGHYYGWGEAVPYARYKESIESVGQQLWGLQKKFVDANVTHEELIGQLEPGSARNALDCAMWDLRAKQTGKNVNELIGFQPPESCTTAQTLSIDTPDMMQQEAKILTSAPLVKVKLDSELVIQKMQAVYDVCPNSQFIVDANEGWTLDVLERVTPSLKAMNVVLIEQPLPAKDDLLLKSFDSPIPLCADESCHTSEHIEHLSKCFDFINIKLDKSGGLSEAIKLYRQAKLRDMGIMVGCMVGTSLAMAPAFCIGNGADFIDLDGPLLVNQDRINGFSFKSGEMSASDKLLWGTAEQSNSIEQIKKLMNGENGQ